jgi:hypothetical protein
MTTRMNFILFQNAQNMMNSEIFMLKSIFIKETSAFKLIHLLSTPNTKELSNLGKYIHFSLYVHINQLNLIG